MYLENFKKLSVPTTILNHLRGLYMEFIYVCNLNEVFKDISIFVEGICSGKTLHLFISDNLALGMQLLNH